MHTLGFATTCPSQPPLPHGATHRPVIDGYEIVECLGRGGCATVYEATHAEHGTVAIKVGELPRASALEADLRLEREALLAKRVSHPNVLQVIDLGHMQDGSPFLVMERLRGEDLESLLERVGRLTLATACELTIQALRGLEAVHAAGIVHRDLKPNNIVLHAKDAWGAPIVKLIDFGVARGVDAEKLTRTGTVIGTPQYLAPEQAQGHAVDARADVWAAGILLYELLVGEGPFEGTSLQETLASILFAEVPSVRIRRPDVPESIANVIATALERDLEKRFPDARAMRTALLAAVEAEGLPTGQSSLHALRILPKKTLPPFAAAREDETPSGVRLMPTAKTVNVAVATKRPLVKRKAWIGVAAASLALTGFASLRGADETPTPAVVTPAHQDVEAHVSPERPRTEAGALASKAALTSMTTPAVPHVTRPSREGTGTSARALNAEQRRARQLASRGRSALAGGRIEEAYRYYDEATDLDPDSAAAWRGFGLAAYQRGNMGEARRAMRRYRSLTE